MRTPAVECVIATFLIPSLLLNFLDLPLLSAKLKVRRNIMGNVITVHFSILIVCAGSLTPYSNVNFGQVNAG